MPKVLTYITAYVTWIFLFYGTDVNENRAHVHVGKKGTERFCKIWLEPVVELAEQGDLTAAHAKQVVEIAHEQRDKLLKQWAKFKAGENVRMLKIKK